MQKLEWKNQSENSIVHPKMRHCEHFDILACTGTTSRTSHHHTENDTSSYLQFR